MHVVSSATKNVNKQKLHFESRKWTKILSNYWSKMVKILTKIDFLRICTGKSKIKWKFMKTWAIIPDHCHEFVSRFFFLVYRAVILKQVKQKPTETTTFYHIIWRITSTLYTNNYSAMFKTFFWHSWSGGNTIMACAFVSDSSFFEFLANF